MNDSLELVRDACEGRRLARTPIYDLLCNDAVVEHFGAGKLDGADDMAVMCRAAGAALDCTRSISPPNEEGTTHLDRMGNTVAYDRWTSWISEPGLKDEPAWVKWIGEEIERLESEPDPGAEACAAAEAEQAALNARLGGTVNIFCTPETAINKALFGYHCGLQMLSYLWFDEPDLVLRWFRAIEVDEQRKIKLQAHASQSPLAMIYSDIAFKGAPMFSREMLQEWGFFDDVARICASCHEQGLTVVFHSDGYVMEVLGDLVAAGIDGLNPIEKAAGMDVYEVRARYPELILVGGVDVTHLLPRGTPEEVRVETRRMLDEVGADGCFLIGSSTELGDDVPLENYLAFHDEVMGK